MASPPSTATVPTVPPTPQRQAAASATANRVPVHLIVVQHGLWGTPGNMEALCGVLQARVKPSFPGERVVIVNSDVNERRKVRDPPLERGGEGF